MVICARHLFDPILRMMVVDVRGTRILLDINKETYYIDFKDESTAAKVADKYILNVFDRKNPKKSYIWLMHTAAALNARLTISGELVLPGEIHNVAN